ncbi:MAG: Flp family type IVb pilin [Acidobacteriaceae bacterium]
MKQLLKRLVAEESGQDLIEWALVASMVALGSVAVMRSYNTNLDTVFNKIGNQLTNAVA